MSVTIDLPSELETVLQQKAQIQGVTMPDLLLKLVRQEAEGGTYEREEIQEFQEADRLPEQLTAKVHRLLGR